MAPDRAAATPTVDLRVPDGRIVLELVGGRCRVRFTGEIDIAFTRDEIARLTAAVRASGRPVDVDCSAVTFFSAEGIRMLVALEAAAVDRRLGELVTSRALDRLRGALPTDRLWAVA